MNPPPHILCAGLVALDLELQVAAFPTMGLKHKATGAQLVGAGGALNAAAAIIALGGRASLRAGLGDDALADLMAARIAARGVPLDHVHRVPGQVTPHSAILIQPDGERTIVNYRSDALCDALPPLPSPFAFDAALCDTRFAALTGPVLAAARAAGKPAVLDVEAPVRLVGDALRQATHLAFSAQGLADLTGQVSAGALRSIARDMGAFACVTQGAGPVLWDDGSQGGALPVPAISAANTNGAGDFWHGAFTLALTQGRDELSAITMASAATARYLSGAAPTDRSPT